MASPRAIAIVVFDHRKALLDWHRLYLRVQLFPTIPYRLEFLLTGQLVLWRKHAFKDVM